MTEPEPLQLYYNLEAKNTTNESAPLRLYKNLNVPLLHNPSQYQLSVIRFVLPNYDTPIFKFLDNTYKITMAYTTFSVTEFVVFEPRTINNKNVFEIQHFIDMLNTTIKTAWTNLSLLVTLPSSDLPYFAYDNVSHLISFVALIAAYDNTLTNPITLSINNILFKMLQGLPVTTIGVPDTEYKLLVQRAGYNINPTGYYQMIQQAPSFENICDFQSIVLTTSIPIENEYIGSDIGIPILTDYCPSDLTIETFHNKIVYNTIVPYRQANIRSTNPLYVIEVKCYWKNVNGELIELFIPPNDTANVKLMFIKK